jgi:hypothetical protein
VRRGEEPGGEPFTTQHRLGHGADRALALGPSHVQRHAR